MELVALLGALFFGGALAWFFKSRQKPAEQIKAPAKADAAPSSVAVTKKPQGFGAWLSKSREAIGGKLHDLLARSPQIDQGLLEPLEEVLYTSDLGPQTVGRIMDSVKSKLTRGELRDEETIKRALSDEIANILSGVDLKPMESLKPNVILVVGVNGVGKTTSIGKLAHYFSQTGKKVLVVAGDTFRAAAAEQLKIWGERAQVEFYSSPAQDPAAVAFEGLQKALASQVDVVLVDTAGRLHNKAHLMEELKKVKRVMAKLIPEAPHQVLLVVDANTGQNALAQAREFNQALGLTGLIVTKLDGTAKGGVIVGIANEIKVGARFVGVGERLEDFSEFRADEFSRGLLFD
ncbi:MAG: signal recognition particle-docking protein FtsY [Oligoflexia bacterium]|nr:signal recognition particle-docking protein FtsY [Oligoflexia bacterium]